MSHPMLINEHAMINGLTRLPHKRQGLSKRFIRILRRHLNQILTICEKIAFFFFNQSIILKFDHEHVMRTGSLCVCVKINPIWAFQILIECFFTYCSLHVSIIAGSWAHHCNRRHMNTGTGITLFPLLIKMDQDGIEFTHVYGGIGHVLTPRELPNPLWTRLHPFVSRLFEGEIQLFELTPKQTSRYRFIPQENVLKELSKEIEETLILTAWWMEWSQRKKVSSRDGWKCLECERYILRSEERCPDSHCVCRD